jgi:hypothetical protein
VRLHSLISIFQIKHAVKILPSARPLSNLTAREGFRDLFTLIAVAGAITAQIATCRLMISSNAAQRRQRCAHAEFSAHRMAAQQIKSLFGA